MGAVDAIVSAVTAALAELDEQLTAIAPSHEGLRDYARLNIEDGTRREITDAIGDYDRRVALLQEARRAEQTLLDTAVAAYKALAGDGHPDLPIREISPAALADLQNNLDTLAAARARFASNAATAMTLTGDPAEPKALGEDSRAGRRSGAK